MLPISCGAILYTRDLEGRPGVILGSEQLGGFLPFKGRPENNETKEEAACREIYEETCGLVSVSVDQIKLFHEISTQRKTYYIGLVQVPYSLLEEFEKKRAVETQPTYMEKRQIKFFPLSEINSHEIHHLARASITFYKANILQEFNTDDRTARYTGVLKL
jgi:ADP-ribose pyrophosphatase YjhB (NUDIX family)